MIVFEFIALILIAGIILLAVYKEFNDWRVQRWYEKTKGEAFATKHSSRKSRAN